MIQQLIDIRVLTVIIAIVVILIVALAGIKKRRNQQRLQPQIGELDELFDDKDAKRDDIIAVRKISPATRHNDQDHDIETDIAARAPVESYRQASRAQPLMKSNRSYQAPQPVRPTQNRMADDASIQPAPAPQNRMVIDHDMQAARATENQMIVDDNDYAYQHYDELPDLDDVINPQADIIVINIFARAGKQFLGYELLQSLLSAGLRYGDMSIFHRHQDKSGRGPVIFSLASATEPGTFDIHKMGGFSGTGLSLFLQLDHNDADFKHFNLMLETAKQLADDLDGLLFNMQREPLTDGMIHQYRQQLADYNN